MGKIYLSVSASQKPLAHVSRKPQKSITCSPIAERESQYTRGFQDPTSKYPKTSAKYIYIYILFICTPIFYVGGLVG
jgi:hypothetical protein